MSKFSSKQTDEVKSLPMINLGINLPEFDKTKYPHGGYGKLRDFGWKVYPDADRSVLDANSHIVRFDDLPSLKAEHLYMCEDCQEAFGHSIASEHYSVVVSYDNNDILVFGYQDGELRLGIIPDASDTYCLSENLCAVELPIHEYQTYVENDELTHEFARDYVQQQMYAAIHQGLPLRDAILQLSIFRTDVYAAIIGSITEHYVGKIVRMRTNTGLSIMGLSFNQACRLRDIIFDNAYMAAEGSIKGEEPLEEKIPHEVCSRDALRTLYENFWPVADYLVGNIIETELEQLNPQIELTRLCARMLNPADGTVVYNPYSALGDLAHVLPSAHVKCVEGNTLLQWAAISRIIDKRGFCKKGTFIQEDPQKSLADASKKYFNIVFIPPYVLSEDDVSSSLKFAIRKLEDDGTMVSVIPLSFTLEKKHSSLRNILIKGKYSVTIVELPNIYCKPLCLVKICNDNKGIFKMADGTSFAYIREYSGHGSLMIDYLLEALNTYSSNTFTIINNCQLDNNLMTPSRYLVRLPQTDFPYRSLDEIVNILELKQTETPTNRYISVVDLRDSVFDNLQATAKRKAIKCYTLTESAILVSITGVMKCGRMVAVPVAVSGNVVAIKANKALITEDYLMHELQSDYVRQQFKAFATGTALNRISRKDLMSIRIAVPSIDEQKTIVAEALKNSLSESEAKLQQQFERYRKEIRTRKHAIVQNLSALDSQWKTLNGFRQRNGGNILANDMIGRINPRPATSFFDTIDAYLITLANQTHHLADVEYDWGRSTNIEPLNFLREYIDTHANDRYSYELKGDDTQKMRILMPTRALRQAIDNIVTNAMSHGFTQMERKDYRIHFSAYSENDKVIILVANNGSALTMQPDMVFAYGASSALNQEYSAVAGSKAVHSGIGGHDTREILQEYGASVEIKSIDPNGNDGYTVVYRLVFNNNIF